MYRSILSILFNVKIIVVTSPSSKGPWHVQTLSYILIHRPFSQLTRKGCSDRPLYKPLLHKRGYNVRDWVARNFVEWSSWKYHGKHQQQPESSCRTSILNVFDGRSYLHHRWHAAFKLWKCMNLSTLYAL